MRNLNSLAFVSSALLLVACSTPMKQDTPVVEKQPTTTVTPKKEQVATDNRVVQPVETKSVDPLNDPKGILAKRSVYFDYDAFVIKDEYKPVVDAHAGYLASRKNRKIIIQGNTDERGGSEYNLALGQKRAEAVRKSLGALGVTDNQMEAVSFGKEKPKALGSNEAAWAENRRADIAYQ